MNEELTKLFKLYAEERLSDVDRRRLSTLLQTEEGRKQALRSGNPEVLFIARHNYREPEWDSYWSDFQSKLETRGRPTVLVFPWVRVPLATAAIILFALIVLPFMPKLGDDAPLTAVMQERTFRLQHRLPQEVMPELSAFMSDNGDLSIRSEPAEITITDFPENLEKIERALQMLDRRPETIRLRLQLIYALDHAADDTMPADVLRQTDSGIRREIDLAKYRVEEDFLITPTDGRQYKVVIDNRFEITCFAEFSRDGKEIAINNITIYDLETQVMVRKSALTVAAGAPTLAPTEHKNEAGRMLILAIRAESDNDRDE